MAKAGYIFKRITRMNYRGLFKTVSRLHKKTGKGRLWLFRDIIRCGLRHGCGYIDYRLCAFYDLTDEQRATYVTQGINNQIVRKLNDPAYYETVESKIKFNHFFADFLGRDWLDFTAASYEDFEDFMKDRDFIITKPLDATHGDGIHKLARADFANLQEMYGHIKTLKAALLEEYLVQHPNLAAIYPDSVNCVRIVTILKDGIVHPVYSFINFGNGGRVVSNLDSGGMAAPVDLATGTIAYGAYDKEENYYINHPATGVPIMGAQIPHWEACMALCGKTAPMIPELKYLGWDIAILQDGIALIEANHFPGYDYLQMPPHTPDKIGMLPHFREFVDGI